MGETKGHDTVPKLIELFGEELKRKIETLAARIDWDLSPLGDLKNRITLEALCWIVMYAAGMNIEQGYDPVESIGFRINLLQNLKHRYEEGGQDSIATGVKMGMVTEKVFQFLICFYEGLLAYYDCYSENRKDFEQCEVQMIKRASEVKYEMSKITLGDYILKFRKLCERNTHSSALSELIGREFICRINIFNVLASNWWSGILNRLKHEKGKPFPSLEEVNKWANQTLELFRFLRDGKVVGIDHQVLTREAVFPHVVSFRESFQKRGGLTIFNYDLASLDGKQEPNSLKILTPRKHMPAEQYYCIPNKDRSSRKFLLEPFLIPCKNFDDALRSG